MSIQKIENLNIHETPATNTNQFDIENYLNHNWEKIKEVVNNNADELQTAQDEQTSQKQDIENLKKENIELREENKSLRSDLNNLIPPVKGEGEDITLERTAEATFKKLEIGGNSWQETREGYNILDLTKISNHVTSGVTINSISPNEIEFKAPAGSTKYVQCSLGVLKAGTYYATKKYQLISGVEEENVIAGQVAFFKVGAGSLLGLDKKHSQGSFTIEEDTDVSMVFYISGSNASTDEKTIKFYEVMLSTQDKPYEPYGSMPSPEFISLIRNCGDNVNLFDLQKFWDNTIAGVSDKELLKTGVKINFNPNQDAIIGVLKNKGDKASSLEISSCSEVKGDTEYTFTMSSAPKCAISPLDKDGVSINGYLSIPSTEDKCVFTFTTPKNTKYLLYRFGYQKDNDVTSWDFVDIALYEGKYTKETLPPYSPYGCGNVNFKVTDNLEQEQSISFPTKEGQVFHKEDVIGDGNSYHYWKTIELTGEENVREVWTEKGSNCCYMISTKFPDSKRYDRTEPIDVICKSSHYVGTYTDSKPDSISNNCKDDVGRLYLISIDCFKTNGNVGNIILKHKGITTIEELKAFLKEQKEAGTPVLVQYKLQEPIIEPFSEEQQEAYEQIKKLKSYEEVTHIYSDDEIKPIIKAEAFADISKLLNSTPVTQDTPLTDEMEGPQMEDPQIDQPQIESPEEGGVE